MSKYFEVVCVNTGAIEENGWPGKSWRVAARNEDEACDKVLEDLESWGGEAHESHPSSSARPPSVPRFMTRGRQTLDGATVREAAARPLHSPERAASDE
jgi:hypothetical protein